MYILKQPEDSSLRVKQQGYTQPAFIDELSEGEIKAIDTSDFDVILLEEKLASSYEKSQNVYFETNYEIDSDKDDCFTSLYRVWDGRVLIGTFYQKLGKWLANPYYKNRKYLRLDYSLSRTFQSNELAIRYIMRCFEGLAK